MAPRKPYRIEAPKPVVSGAGKELGKALQDFLKPDRRVTGGRGRRTVSNNPSLVNNAHLRVATPKPKSPLSAYDRVVLGFTDEDVVPEEEGQGSAQTEYLSPPNTIFPERPRAHEASWDPDTRNMRVVFRNGGTYVYFGVTRRDWSALKRNRSFGQTLDRLVIGTYPFQKIAGF